MTATAARSRSAWSVVALALPAATLLAGCSADPEPVAAPATSESPAASAATTTPAPTSAGAPATAAADAPACPDAAVLAAVAPDQAPGVQLTDPTCSGPWAVIGISGPTVGPVVQVFRYADGAWQPADRDAVCAAGELPADIEPGVCQAG
ncbi:hypothetical protein KUM42_09545 [Modestobacter sp. L9-4]|uniref:hypothetical protein n=1 Tax=Modestobacter sp. L9-4 TaxID=2851567 RepID=UPI001C74EC3E|nr:hypothetical protein [Modestobacter sp. L9-4]QXG77711.1 hypothetical protein KUM42_09545 [Modestobacter sp. L9-4]